MQQWRVPTSERRRSTPKPKSWVLDPAERQSFGRVHAVGWKVETDPEESVSIRAAQMQHLVSIQVRRHAASRQAAGEEGWSLPALSERLETLNYDGLMRVLRGDVHMTLLHAVDLSRVLQKRLVALGEPVRPA